MAEEKGDILVRRKGDNHLGWYNNDGHTAFNSGSRIPVPLLVGPAYFFLGESDLANQQVSIFVGHEKKLIANFSQQNHNGKILDWSEGPTLRDPKRG